MRLAHLSEYNFLPYTVYRFTRETLKFQLPQSIHFKYLFLNLGNFTQRSNFTDYGGYYWQNCTHEH